MKRGSFLIVGFVVIYAIALLAPQIQPLKNLFGETNLLNHRSIGSRKLAQALTGMGLLHTKPASAGAQSVQQFALGQKPLRLPSSQVLSKHVIEKGLPTVSVVVSDYDINDKDEGIFANFLGQGKKWERPAYVSYYNQGKLKYESGVGLRVHGGASRWYDKRSLKLFFSPLYGAKKPPKGVFHSDGVTPMTSVVLHNDIRWEHRFHNPITQSLIARLGGITPQFTPANVYLNGELQGLFFVTEHLNEAFLEKHYGHKDFIFLRTKDNHVQLGGSKRFNKELRGWLKTPRTFDQIQAHVDLESYTRWLVTVLFCASVDPFQGPLLLDLTKKGSRWFWIPWDLDWSFHPLRAGNPPWAHDTFGYILREAGKPQSADPRARILLHLHKDQRFGSLLRQQLSVAMEQRWTPSYLERLINKYESVSDRFKLNSSEQMKALREFFTHRPRVVREMTEKYLRQPTDRRL